MSFFSPPDTPARTSGDSADTPLPWRFDTLLEQQQRWWHEWVEAGNLWSSWWLSTLPSFGWPPAGQVVPTAPLETDAEAPGPSKAADHLVEVVTPRPARPRPPRPH